MPRRRSSWQGRGFLSWPNYGRLIIMLSLSASILWGASVVSCSRNEQLHKPDSQDRSDRANNTSSMAPRAAGPLAATDNPTVLIEPDSAEHNPASNAASSRDAVGGHTADPFETVAGELKSELLPIPAIDLQSLEPMVARQIQSAQQALDELLSESVSRGELAEGYSALGQLFHAYKLNASAQPCYENGIRLLPQDFRLYQLLGVLAEQQGDLEAAVLHFRNAMERNDSYEASAVRLGRMHLQLNRVDEARKTLGQALEINPKSAAAHAGLGDLFSLIGDFEQAIDHYSVALQKVPSANRIHYSLAIAYRNSGDNAKATEHFQKHGKVGVQPHDPIVEGLRNHLRGEHVQLILGRRAFNAGHYSAAVEAFLKAVEANPDSSTAHVNLGSAYGQLGEIGKAIQHYQTALKLDEGNLPAHFNLGVLLNGREQYSEALPHFEFVVRNRETDLEARLQLAETLARVDRLEDALLQYATALNAAPSSEQTLLRYASLLIQQLRYADAGELLDDANRRFPDRGRTAHTLAVFLATCPDLSLRDGPRAVELASAVLQAQSSIQHGETMAMAMAECGRCGESAALQAQLIAKAEQAGEDQPIIQRLKRDLQRYRKGSPCRPAVESAVAAGTTAE